MPAHTFLHIKPRIITTHRASSEVCFHVATAPGKATYYYDMLLQGRAFDGSFILLTASRDVEAIAGLPWWINEFQPITYAERRFIEHLLFILCGHDTCYAVWGKFGGYTAGINSTFTIVPMFIAKTENPRLVSLLQLVPNATFLIGP